MANYLNIRNGFVVNNGQELTGTTISIVGPGSDYALVTEKSVVDYFSATSITTLSGLTDTTINSPTYEDILYYSAGTWLNTPKSTILGDYYTKTESDNNFVNVTGDTMTGGLIINDASGYALEINGDTIMRGDLFVSGTTTTIHTTDLAVADNIIILNSGETSSGVTKGSSGIRIDRGVYDDYFFLFDEVRDAFTIGTMTGETVSDVATLQPVATREDTPDDGGIAYWNDAESRLDTNSGITISGDNIVTSGLVDGVDVSVFYSDYLTFTGETENKSLSGLTDVTITAPVQDQILVYSAGTWVNNDSDIVDAYTKSESDLRFVHVTGDTMTGDLTISTLAGTNDRVVTVDATGQLQETEHISFKSETTGIAALTTTDTFASSDGNAVIWDYVVYDSSNFRTGSVRCVWSGTTTEWDETSTQDLGDTSGFGDFSTDIDGSSNVRLRCTPTSGTWNVSIRRTIL